MNVKHFYQRKGNNRRLAGGVAAGKGRRTARVIIKCLVIITAVEVFCFLFSRCHSRICVSRWAGGVKVESTSVNIFYMPICIPIARIS